MPCFIKDINNRVSKRDILGTPSEHSCAWKLSSYSLVITHSVVTLLKREFPVHDKLSLKVDIKSYGFPIPYQSPNSLPSESTWWVQIGASHAITLLKFSDMQPGADKFLSHYGGARLYAWRRIIGCHVTQWISSQNYMTVISYAPPAI